MRVIIVPKKPNIILKRSVELVKKVFIFIIKNSTNLIIDTIITQMVISVINHIIKWKIVRALEKTTCLIYIINEISATIMIIQNIHEANAGMFSFSNITLALKKA